MRGLRAFLLISLVYTAIITLIYVFFPTRAADAELGPADLVSARYVAVMFLSFTIATWYAYRNPAKNVAVVMMLIVLYSVTAVIALYNGVTGAEKWPQAMVSLVSGLLLAAGMAYFFPRGRRPD